MTPSALRSFESGYMDLFWRRQRLQWEIYAEGMPHDLSVLDRRTLRWIQENEPAGPPRDRRERLIRSVTCRELVELHPSVAELRNRLDDGRSYEVGLPADPPARRLELARRMRPDVLRLMARRQEQARRQGYPGYVDLVLAGEEAPRAPLEALLRRVLQRELPRARALARNLRLTLPGWFSGLARHGGPAPSPLNGEGLLDLLGRLGLGDAAGSVRVVVRDQPIHGYAAVLDGRGDIRILLRPGGSLAHGLTLAHEWGHAVAHASNREEGIFRTWSASFDEAMAVLLERLAVRLHLPPELRARAREIQRLETVRLALSSLFELALWEDPGNPEALHAEHYGRLGIEIGSPELWSLDSFRSIDPVYTPWYVLGAEAAEEILDHLEERFPGEPSRWGPWIAQHLYADGRRRSLAEKLAEALGDGAPSGLLV